VCQELDDERVLVARFDGERRQCERYSERSVIAERSRCNGTRVRWMGIVDPNGAVDQPREFRIGSSRLELHQQAVPRWAPSTGHSVERLRGHGRVCVRLPICGRDSFIFGRGQISRGWRRLWRRELLLHGRRRQSLWVLCCATYPGRRCALFTRGVVSIG